MSAWVLPDYIADVLPSEARCIEELRRRLLDAARGYGYELVIPPLLEYLESLLTGTGQALDLQTFKLVDQLSGRTMGVRADSTPQVARIDAHLLNRQGVARLCYCGPVLHTSPAKPHATREPLQFGAEIYGHAGLEADLEIMLLALDCLHRAGLKDLTVDLADAQIVRNLLAGVPVSAEQLAQIHAALAAKDSASLQYLAQGLAAEKRQALLQLVKLYGGPEVLSQAEIVLEPSENLRGVLSNLKHLAASLQAAQPNVKVSVDLGDASGYAYYTGARFAIYAPSSGDAVARGGRYDEVGAVFGRNRPAVGFSLDIKDVVSAGPKRALQTAIRAPWSEQPSLRQAIARLRIAGEVVICELPGHEAHMQEFECNRELVEVAGQWVVRSI
jgi:ATP phosphoribosyltransferase regulatory subunit